MQLTLKPIAEQVAVVMGASSGIGRKTAQELAAQGAKVVVSARSIPGLDSLVEEISGAGGRAVAQPADVSDFDQVAAVAQRAVDEFGGLDTWVHAAAVTIYAPFDQLTPEELRRVIDVDLIGQGYGALAAVPHLKERGGGALIHISSMLAERSYPLQAPYCAAKHGIKGLVDSMRIDFAHQEIPISVTNIMPASTDTPLFDKARSKLGVVPTAPPPVYDAAVVARAILDAAEHPQRQIVVGGAGKAQLLIEKLSPRAMDVQTAVGGSAMQRTDEPTGALRPGNLFEPVTGLDTVEGHFGATRSHSSWTWVDRYRGRLAEPVGRAATGLAARAGRLISREGRGNGHEPESGTGPSEPAAGAPTASS